MNGKSKLTTLRVLAASGVLAFGISSLALAGGGANSGNGSPPKAGVVGATNAGMPATAQVRWIVVNSDGTKARSYPSTLTVAPDSGFPGGYIVTVPGATVSGCAFAGSLGQPGNAGVESGEISAQGAAASANGVYVYTRDSAGTPTPKNFHLTVSC
jgi:hypothetical protein